MPVTDSILKPTLATADAAPIARERAKPTNAIEGVSPDLSQLEALLRHSFSRRELLEQALTHSSQSHERRVLGREETPAVDNEQMEFLGDAVLGFVTAEELCRRFPNFQEGELSKNRAHLVSQKHLIKVSQELQLGNYLRLGRGEEKSGGRNKTALLVDALEAVLAAIYLDGGMAPARDFIVRQIMNPELERIASSGTAVLPTDYKSTLQEKLQAEGRPQPVYVLVREDGPEHRKAFTVEARLKNKTGGSSVEYTGRATGPTKKSAEQESARQVLEHLVNISDTSTFAKLDEDKA